MLHSSKCCIGKFQLVIATSSPLGSDRSPESTRTVTGQKKSSWAFYHIWAWRPSYSCDLDFIYTLVPTFCRKMGFYRPNGFSEYYSNLGSNNSSGNIHVQREPNQATAKPRQWKSMLIHQGWFSVLYYRVGKLHTYFKHTLHCFAPRVLAWELHV